jgi:hypothetical protein
MTLLEKLAATKNPILLALINPYRNPDNHAAPEPSEADKHQTPGFRKVDFRKTSPEIRSARSLDRRQKHATGPPTLWI